ncbi:hypothetical protein ACWIGI_11545 [Nocardia sp. NPDC055321]
MSWDTWALLAINLLCVAVIAWAAWGFHQESRDARPLRIALAGGGSLLVPPASGRGGRWHRAQHRGRA